MTDNCANCARLEAELKRWQAIATRLQQRVDALIRVIQRIRKVCDRIQNDAGDKLRAGNLPRGSWSFLKGQVDAVKRIKAVIN